MNKRITRLLALLSVLVSPIIMHTAKSASASITVSSNNSTILVGTKINVSYKVSSGVALGAWDFQLVTPSNFTLNSCTNNQLAHQVGVVANGSTYSTTITCSFTAKSTGSGTFSVKNYSVEDYNVKTMTTTSSSKTIKVITQQELENSYSKNNNLKTLEVSGYELNPAFDKNTLIYSVELPPLTYKVSVNGTKEDTTATISGLGEKDLTDGLNTITIIVTAQNKSTKTYTINITVKELEPINIKIGEEEFTVVRKSSELKKPNDFFKEKTIQINGKDVPTFINEKTNTTLVGLKNTKGEIKLYTYNEKDNTYNQFKSIEFSKLSLKIESERGKIPNNYKEKQIKINEDNYTVYKLSGKSNYSLFNAKNLSTGEETIYMYDEKDNTIQKYNDEEITILENKYKESKRISTYIIISLALILLLTYVIILITIMRNKKKNNNVIKNRKKEDNNSENTEEEKSEELVQKMEEELDFFDRKAKKKKK